MLAKQQDPVALHESPGLSHNGERLSNAAKRYIGGIVSQLRIWHECQSLERELSDLDNATLLDLGLARAQISRFVSAYSTAGELLSLMLEHLELAGAAAPILRWTYEDLLRARPVCNEHCHCADRRKDGPGKDRNRDFCPNAWLLDQLRRSRYRHAIPFRAGPIAPHLERLG